MGVRRRLKTGEEIPSWFSYPKVVEILREAHPPNHKKGLTIFFTGLSGSGKSTIANALCEKLMEVQERRVSILDGDYMRKLVSNELGSFPVWWRDQVDWPLLHQLHRTK